MPLTTEKLTVSAHLRDSAEKRIKEGTAPPAETWASGVGALSLLYRLSSSPDTAEDALKLLHELQVHQVELDLQNEAIAAREQTLVEELSLYQEFFESAPLGYLLVDGGCVVVRCNPAAAELFDIALEDLMGRCIDKFLTAQNRPPLLALVGRVTESGTRDSCMTVLTSASASRPLMFMASKPKNGDHVLLACCECPGNG